MDAVYIGIDPTAGRRPMDYAVLNGDLELVARGLGRLEAVLDVVRSYPAAVVAVDAPQSPNAGLMASPARRRKYGLSRHDKVWSNYKVCEYELQRRGIRLYSTPGEIEAAPLWMQIGFQLYGALKNDGYRMYRPGLSAARRLIEVHPHASYTVLLGHLPLRKDSLEGRLQRQLVLHEEGMRLPDPLNAFEEITRHHLLEGDLSLPGLYTHDELDALVSAYTAYLAANRPDRLTLVGDPAEGQIAVPAPPGEFKDLYR